ncbi:MAG: MFS transporter [Verrucomicrobia bacterium]|nr:MFS transporter [Verrucomicrobiota bacterium]
MLTTSVPKPVVPRMARVTIFLAFFANGFLSTSWAVHIPRIKGLLGLSDGALGLCLWAATLGLFLGMTLGGWIVDHYHGQFVTGIAGLSLGLATILAVVSASWLALVLSLVPFGFFNGLMDVSMNSQAAAFEQRTGRAVMSSFHAFFSLGGLTGTLFGAALLAAKWPASVHVLIAAVPFMIVGCFMHRGLIPEEQHRHPQRFFISVPTSNLLPLAIMAFVFFLTEGVVFDWSGVFLKTELGVDVSAAGIGYAAFSLLMASIRFSGDYWVARFGRFAVFVVGAAVGAAGLMLACLSRNYVMSVAGFGLVGVGLANCIPLIFSAAARQKEVSFGRAIASVASAGYFGLFVGPPIMGSIAQLIGLQRALLLVAGVVILTLLLARKGLRPSSNAAQVRENAPVQG